MYALKSGDVTNLPSLPLLFSQFSCQRTKSCVANGLKNGVSCVSCDSLILCACGTTASPWRSNSWSFGEGAHHHLSRYVVLALLKDESARSFAHALIAHLFCSYSTPRVLLSDNGAEFCNQVLAEICNQFGLKHCFTDLYHPASNGFVEHANRKKLSVLRPVVCGLLHNWEDWLLHVATSINNSVYESTGESPYFILYELKRNSHDLLSNFSTPVYNVDDYVQCHLNAFSDIH